MDSYGEGPRSVDVGFAGGQAIALRLREAQYDALRDSLGSDSSERWHRIEADGADVTLDLSQVVYIRLDTQERRAGFRGA
jgi:hypothetical protein